ncbi:DUF1800 domain-containing protein [Paraburkholderia tropica]|uniref:DUF1800 domain-containing protein n=1 Tax=Paraburkholderia tropica TaxID=92647 RepID=UPI00161C5F1E|nr:DUF1800 domain-containing protein [Paraburkholderia tropica]MBB2984764.1 uncharacterized protein (DUF1800 family) [Paraburkholderia tropica]
MAVVQPPAAETSAGTILDGDDARFLLERTGFAPDPQEVAAYVGLTREQAVDRLLATARRTAVTPLPAWFAEPVPTPQEQHAWTQEDRRAQESVRGERYQDARAWWVREMLVTPSPLTERMTMFWHNHFVSGQDKVPWPQTMLAQNVLLRRDALGNFRAMLHDIAKDPAMLQYLDGASNRKGHPNENFAREVMELFTLGEGHYSQHDVAEAARAYTGWGLDGNLYFVSRPGLHDSGPKTVFGNTANLDGDQMLDLLLARPETTNFVTAKLWHEFVSDKPDPAQVNVIAGSFRSSGYDIRTVLRALFLSQGFWDQEGQGTLARSPVDFVIGTIRSFDVGYGSPQQLANTLRGLGQDLYEPPNVKGWPGGPTWINSSTLLERDRFVEAVLRSSGNGPATGGTDRQVSGAHAQATVTPVALKAPARLAGDGLHFDPARWLAEENASATGQPDAVTRRRLERAVLATHPVEPVSPDDDGRVLLEALLTDPAYQLK